MITIILSNFAPLRSCYARRNLQENLNNMKTKLFLVAVVTGLLFLTSCGSTKKAAYKTKTSKHKKIPISKQRRIASNTKNTHPIRTKKLTSDRSYKPNTATDFYSIYSEKLTITLAGLEDKKLIEVVASWKGTPYLYAGNNKTGVDCSGFVGAVYQEVYNKQLHRRSRDMLLDVKVIKKSELRVGDLIFFKTGEKSYVSHVGIYIADNKFIHAASRGVVVNDLSDTYYRKAYYKSGRVK